MQRSRRIESELRATTTLDEPTVRRGVHTTDSTEDPRDQADNRSVSAPRLDKELERIAVAIYGGRFYNSLSQFSLFTPTGNDQPNTYWPDDLAILGDMDLVLCKGDRLQLEVGPGEGLAKLTQKNYQNCRKK